jgi:hypothetical protein
MVADVDSAEKDGALSTSGQAGSNGGDPVEAKDGSMVASEAVPDNQAGSVVAANGSEPAE